MLKYIETDSNDPYYNLAFEEYILLNKTDGDWLMLWQNANTVVIGLNQNTAEEINAPFIEEHKVNVVRRNTGGGAVYHDLGNLNYSFITDAGDKEKLSIEQFSKPVCDALESFGLYASVGGRNDISVEGKKISGVAQRVSGSRILHHGTLLFKSDPEMIAGALNVDPAKFASKSSKSVRSRVGNIYDFLEKKMTLTDFWNALREKLGENGMTECGLSDAELREVERIADEKYRTWDWNYGRNPSYSYTNKARYAGGTLEVKLNAEKGRIAGISFAGDFMAVTDCSAAVAALKNAKLERASVISALSSVDIKNCFGEITAGEIADTIFGAIQ